MTHVRLAWRETERDYTFGLSSVEPFVDNTLDETRVEREKRSVFRGVLRRGAEGGIRTPRGLCNFCSMFSVPKASISAHSA